MTGSYGMVYLVGGGPGDPGLITVRGREVLHRADVVLHDRLAPLDLLAELDDSVEIIDVGKSTGRHPSQQAEIERIMVDRASRGQCVVRLKGGDPFVFGRGYEEMQTCRANGVPCVVIPGVSSAFAAPAVVGIPITSRKLVRTFAVMTASVAGDSEANEPDYEALASLDVVVVLMGRKKLGDVVEAFRSAGLDASTPVACIENATLPQQRVVVGTLATIAEAVTIVGLAPPVTTVIGQVAALGDVPGTLSELGLADAGGDAMGRSVARWKASPIAGKRVLVTRPVDRSQRLVELLRASGAIPVLCPLTQTVFPDEMPDLDDAIRQLPRYSFVAFTSVNGVQGFWKRLRRLRLDARVLGSCKVAAVDGGTSAALLQIGVAADLVGDGHGASGLAKQIVAAATSTSTGAGVLTEMRVLFPRSDRAMPTLTDTLARAGMPIDAPVAYRTVAVTGAALSTDKLRGGADVIVFYSPSSVEAFLSSGIPVRDAVIACIGKTTAAGAVEGGLTPAIVCDRPSDDAMVEAITMYFGSATATA